MASQGKGIAPKKKIETAAQTKNHCVYYDYRHAVIYNYSWISIICILNYETDVIQNTR